MTLYIPELEEAGIIAHDKHYRNMPVEPIDLMQSILTPEEYKGFLKGNIIKYSLRAGRKEGEPSEKDVQKYQNYKQLLARWLEYEKAYD